MLLRRLDSVFVVREDAVQAYRKRYPHLAHRFNFIPTWMDPEVFSPASAPERARLRKALLKPLGIQEDHIVMVFVGRLDKQKDPLLLLDSFSNVLRTEHKAHLLLIGDGVLRHEVEQRIEGLGLKARVSLAGLVGPRDVANYLRSSDLFVLSSAYEGMPMCVLEAMGSGLPVAATDVGEIRRIVTPGINGEIAAARTENDLAEAVLSCVKSLAQYKGQPCLEVAARYVPGKVLKPVYENYRRLAHRRSV
jgi:glycosyltransferase involved in cell wall biosynthesis